MKQRFLWFFFFILCMAVGFLHGVLPQGLTRSFFSSPKKIQVVTTDEIFFPPQMRQQLEQEFRVKFAVTITRDWETLLSKTVATPSADLIFLPSFWANSLAQQNLLGDIAGPRKELQQRVSSDFLATKEQSLFYFLPFYWMKTHLRTPQGENFSEFLKNKKEQNLFLIADEDLLLLRFTLWKNQGLWDLLAQKKILTNQLDQIDRDKSSNDRTAEVPVTSDSPDLGATPWSALLIWGAAIPSNSQQKELVLEILDTMTTPEHQERRLLETPFSSTFSTVSGSAIPFHRRADFIRNLQLKDTLILENKDLDAKNKLKNNFNFIL